MLLSICILLVDFVDTFALLPTIVYFPSDCDSSSPSVYTQLLNFSYVAYQNLITQPSGGIYTSRLGYDVGMSSTLQSLGYNFDGYYESIYAPLCENCASFTVIAYGM